MRPTSRHFQPALTPPEDQSADDAYGWLFRDEPRTQPSPGEPDDTVPRSATAVAPPAFPRQPVAPRPAPRRRRVLPVAVACLVVAVLAGIGIAVAQRFGSETGSTTTTTSASAPASTAPPVGIVPLETTADCLAPDATDDGGQPVSYAPQNLFDRDTGSAWRCDGAATARTLTFRFSPGTVLRQVGLINGYAKVDPASRTRRYGEYRRVTAVSWTFPDGTVVRQQLSDSNEGVQWMAVPGVAADSVTLTIDGSTPPGSPAATRNAVLISEIAFA
jgi:hypothetical protein